MKRFALLAAFGVVLVSSIVVAQVRQNGRLLLGDTSTPIRMNGKLETNASIFPLDTTLGFIVDGGMSVVGNAAINGATTINGNLTATATTQSGGCTLNGATPSVCTATVKAASVCVCSPVGATAAIAAGGCATGVSSTTLTITSAAGLTNVVKYWCF